MNYRVLIDCPEQIPCNPCETVCPRNLIRVGPDISAIPTLDNGECSGCGRCIAICPGLAIRVLGISEDSMSGGMAELLIPHEYLPMPSKDELVALADQDGCCIGSGRVLRVSRPLRGDPTAVVRILVDAATAERAVGILRRPSTEPAASSQPVVPLN